MATDAIVVMVTTSSEDEAVAIANHLVRDHLAACVSLFPVSSIYTWDKQVHHDQEWQLVIKTQQDKFTTLEAKVRELHTYDVPEIIALPVTAGSMPYLNWISAQVHS